MINKRVLLSGIVPLVLISCGKQQDNNVKENVDSLKSVNEQLTKQLDSLKVLNTITEGEEMNTQMDIQKAGGVAAEFLNYYVATNQVATDLVTSNFLKIYRNNEIKIKKSQEEAGIMGDVWEPDPAKGEKEGVLLGQDYDNEYKFSKVLKTEDNTIYLLLQGVNYTNFKNTVKMIYVNGQWKVDGAGDLNIPKSLQR